MWRKEVNVAAQYSAPAIQGVDGMASSRHRGVRMADETQSPVLEVVMPISQETVYCESDLLRRARLGDHQAFDVLARRYTSRILATSRRILRNAADAEDNVQNVLFKAYTNLRSFHENSLVSTWLIRITINEALMKLRSSVSEKRYTVSSDDPVMNKPMKTFTIPTNPETRCIARELVSRALKSVPPDLRNSFVLFAVNGWTQKELSRTQGIRLQTVKARIFRARRKMKEQLSE
jgi:RNA polymerase sigma-70 factor, ECF subfamily